MLWVRVYTDEGLVGLGETFFGARAVEAYIHESAAMTVLGRDPFANRAYRPGPHALHRLRGYRRRDPGALRGGYRAVGSLRQGDGTAGLSVAGRAQSGPNPHLQHLRGLSLRSKPSRLGDRRLGARRRRGGPVRRPRRLPPPRRRARAQSAGAGHHGDEDLAVRPRGGGLRRLLHLSPRSRLRARAVPQDSRCGGEPDGHHGGAAFAVAAPCRGQNCGCPRAFRSLLVRGTPFAWTVSQP